MTIQAQLNDFMVQTFNGILRNEEQSLCNGESANLTMCEIHVMACVCSGGGEAKMSEVAEALGKTQGTLTVAVNTLVKKEYLIRQHSDKDKRIILLQATDKGLRANARHTAYHEQLVASICEKLSPAQLQALCGGLKILTDFFRGEQ